MTALILDTSSAQTIIALSKNGELIDSAIYLHQNKLSALLTTSIETILKKHDLSPKDLRSICVGIGPGSYTGTRVGVAVAKSLSLALEIPLVPFCSLLAYVPENTLGRFGFFMETKQGSPFLLEACAELQGFSSIEWRIISSSASKDISKSIPYFSLDSENFFKTHPDFLSFSLQKTQPFLAKLCIYLEEELKKNRALCFSRLDTLELVYLHSIALPHIPVEALIETLA